MKKTAKFTVMAAGALTLASMFSACAFAEPRRDDSWRDSRYERRDQRRDDRDFLRGTVERIDRRRDVVVLRDARSGRTVLVQMHDRNRGIDVEDLRRGDRVTFVGDWSRNGVFTAWRIDDVDSGRRGNRRW
ncbi:MAG TPA: hypothetical protein VEO54_29895 [Thermoanaerobaculia bacterium]|nr:hypothetical protein [Thermoanaerobaculia bacterium]